MICVYILEIIFLNYLCVSSEKHYSMIKVIDKELYIGGRNYLAKFSIDKLEESMAEQYRFYDTMNGSDIGFKFNITGIKDFEMGPKTLAFDTCLNWKQEHPSDEVRETAVDYQHWKYHTPSGDFNTMNFSCMNSFIRAVELLNSETLWVCGTFGAFPRAFTVKRSNLEFIRYVDSNVMSCARYIDEPMASFKTKETNQLYVASGWGLYKPANSKPDVPNNNSTMMYSDWKLYRNLFTLPSAMAWVLSSDVNFINVVKETDQHLYFFGHEINNQYGLNNQEDKHAWQSFMLRICKDDAGYKYIPDKVLSDLGQLTPLKYYIKNFNNTDIKISPTHSEIDYSKDWFDNTAHLPKTHFTSPLKVNFGCYIGKRPRAISDNHFWGDSNVVYINKLADVVYDPNRKIKFQTKSTESPFGCSNNTHFQVPLIGIFNDVGIKGTQIKPSGALCQLQINENIFNEIGSKREIYCKNNFLEASNSYEELMGISSTSYSNFYDRSIHRTNGYTLHPYWNQGVLIGSRSSSYTDAFNDIGKCKIKVLNDESFLKIQNFSNIAWPNELPNRLSSISSAICQYSAAELYSFNATFVVPGVEFKRIFILRENITDYVMHTVNGSESNRDRKYTSPLMIAAIISTCGHLYRVVLCDFDNGMLNHGENKTSDKWYNWCIFRHTDQPYLYRQYTPMERREWNKSYQFRASSLLLDKKIVTKEDESSFPVNRDPQFHIVKDVLKHEEKLIVLTSKNVRSVNIEIDCGVQYQKCIDCSSDPDCMWNIKSKQCVKYVVAQYKESAFVQDVLDRGFRCAQVFVEELKSTDYTISVSFISNSILPCLNAGFWRGKIQWKINDLDVDNDSVDYEINAEKNYLVLFKNADIIQKVSCHGSRIDVDKLYGDEEYKWIERMNLTDISLNIYTAKSSIHKYWQILAISFIVTTLVLLSFLILFYFCCRGPYRGPYHNVPIELCKI